MGTIVERARKNGSKAFLAKISFTRNGKIALRENKTFDRRQAAAAWIARREEELLKPGALEAARTPKVTLGQIIDRYTEECGKAPGRTKAQALKTLRDQDIAEMDCSKITSQDLVDLARGLNKGRKPQTVTVYMSHLATVIKLARPAWGYQIDRSVMNDAIVACRYLGLTARADERERRPSLDELDRILAYFEDRQARRPNMVQMAKIILFAIFSCRRQEEITLLRWGDMSADKTRILARNMKDPRKKAGNNVWCELPPEALAIINSMPRRDERIFPYTTVAISAAFTRATTFLGIDDLHFHDLRHEGISRLFEMGRTIPQAAAVSAHKSWSNLSRYTHVMQSGDKYAGWKWLPTLTQLMPTPTRIAGNKNFQENGDPAIADQTV